MTAGVFKASGASVVRDQSLRWQDVATVASGGGLSLSDAAWARIAHAHNLVHSIVAKGIRAYGVNTGVGALCDVLVDEAQQSALARNIIMSHATGFGPLLGQVETRAILAAAVNNFAHGYSGLRAELVQHLLRLLNSGVVPAVPRSGSAGYLTHMAHASLVLLGHGKAWHGDAVISGAEALSLVGLESVRPGAKEGICLVAGSPCSTGLACVALDRAQRLMDWADAISAMSFECLHGNLAAIHPEALRLRQSAGLQLTGARLNNRLRGSAILAGAGGSKTQDCISIRSLPHVHGAAHDSFAALAETVDLELASVTDNPTVEGHEDAPVVRSHAHGVAATLAHGLDSFAIALASVGAMAERRIDRMLNPMVSGMPAFLASGSGVSSGLMIAQYTAVALVGENRRLAAPASLDGGITSALQEDHLVHATAAAQKLLDLLDNVQRLFAIEYLVAAQALSFQQAAPAAGTRVLHQRLRQRLPPYADDRPLADDMEMAFRLIGAEDPTQA